jgi:hypothetical protein
MIFAVRNSLMMILIIFMLHLLLCNGTCTTHTGTSSASYDERFVTEDDAEESKHRELLQYVMQDNGGGIASEVSVPKKEESFPIGRNQSPFVTCSADVSTVDTITPYDGGDAGAFALCSPVEFEA